MQDIRLWDFAYIHSSHGMIYIVLYEFRPKSNVILYIQATGRRCALHYLAQQQYKFFLFRIVS